MNAIRSLAAKFVCPYCAKEMPELHRSLHFFECAAIHGEKDLMAGSPTEADRDEPLTVARLLIVDEISDWGVDYKMARAATKLTALETQCLTAFVGLDEAQFLSFKRIASRSGIGRELVRPVVRACARKGLLEYARGLFNDDGDVAGAGYGLTAKGHDWLKEHVA